MWNPPDAASITDQRLDNYWEMDTLPSFDLRESVYCTVSEERVVRRTWKERLLSWPWKPWVAEKTIFIQVPDEHVYQIGRYTFVCHPAIAKQIREQFPT